MLNTGINDLIKIKILKIIVNQFYDNKKESIKWIGSIERLRESSKVLIGGHPIIVNKIEVRFAEKLELVGMISKYDEENGFRLYLKPSYFRR